VRLSIGINLYTYMCMYCACIDMYLDTEGRRADRGCLRARTGTGGELSVQRVLRNHNLLVFCVLCSAF